MNVTKVDQRLCEIMPMEAMTMISLLRNLTFSETSPQICLLSSSIIQTKSFLPSTSMATRKQSQRCLILCLKTKSCRSKRLLRAVQKTSRLQEESAALFIRRLQLKSLRDSSVSLVMRMSFLTRPRTSFRPFWLRQMVLPKKLTSQ